MVYGMYYGMFLIMTCLVFHGYFVVFLLNIPLHSSKHIYYFHKYYNTIALTYTLFS
jgi:hypothetical protein